MRTSQTFWSWTAVSFVICAMTAGCRSGHVGGDRPSPAPGVDVLEFSYGLELEDRDGSRQVTEDFPFRSGDRFRFALEAGFPAYAYLYNRGAGEGSYTRLFPPDPSDDPRPLPAGEVMAPSEDAWYRMDTEAGVEQMVLVVATAPLAELDVRDDDLEAAAFEQQLGALEQTYRPAGFRRNRVGERVELAAEQGDGEVAMVVRIPLRHEEER